jgi:hypothetical protein
VTAKPAELKPKQKPIVLIHGYSAEGKHRAFEEIYQPLLKELRDTFGGPKVVEIDLSKWISLSDGIALDDVSFALDRALKSPKHSHLLDSGFNVIIHSTGALVVRNWIRLFGAKPCRIENLIHLAGASFGSGLAHIGRGKLARWIRQIFQGLESGIHVLDELEFGASKTLDLHLHFFKDGQRMCEDYGVREVCLIGSRTTDLMRKIPIRYVREDSSDGVVRTSSGNLNFDYVIVTPTDEAYAIGVKDLDKIQERRLDNKSLPKNWYQFNLSQFRGKGCHIPFALQYEITHSGPDWGIVGGSKNRQQILDRIKEALTLDSDAAYRALVSKWNQVTASTLKKAEGLTSKKGGWNKQKQYEGHSQLIFRIRDQFGYDVEHHDITFKSSDAKPAGRPKLENMIEDVHVNRINPGTATYYLRTVKYNAKTKEWANQLRTVAPLQFEISGFEPDSVNIRYLPLSLRLTSTQLQTLIQPYRTTVFDVALLRLPTDKVFALKKDAPLN